MYIKLSIFFLSFKNTCLFVGALQFKFCNIRKLWYFHTGVLYYFDILKCWTRDRYSQPGYSNLRPLKYWIRGKKYWFQNIVLLRHFLLDSGFDKLWRQNIELIIYFISITYGGTAYYGRNIFTHSFVIAITEKVQIIAMVFHITLHALNYRPWVTISVQ